MSEQHAPCSGCRSWLRSGVTAAQERTDQGLSAAEQEACELVATWLGQEPSPPASSGKRPPWSQHSRRPGADDYVTTNDRYPELGSGCLLACLAAWSSRRTSTKAKPICRANSTKMPIPTKM